MWGNAHEDQTCRQMQAGSEDKGSERRRPTDSWQRWDRRAHVGDSQHTIRVGNRNTIETRWKWRLLNHGDCLGNACASEDANV